MEEIDYKIRDIQDVDRGEVAKKLIELFGSCDIHVLGNVYRADLLDAFVVISKAKVIGFLGYEFCDNVANLIAIYSLNQKQGIGTELLEKFKAHALQNKISRVHLITTNDNLPALGFYQKRGFLIGAVHYNSVVEARKYKPSIPEIGYHGIPIRDEIELYHILGEGGLYDKDGVRRSIDLSTDTYIDFNEYIAKPIKIDPKVELKIEHLHSENAIVTETTEKLNLILGEVSEGVIVKTGGDIVCNSMNGQELFGENIKVHVAQQGAIYAENTLEVTGELKYFEKIQAFNLDISPSTRTLSHVPIYTTWEDKVIPYLEFKKLKFQSRIYGPLRLVCSRDEYECIAAVKHEVVKLMQNRYKLENHLFQTKWKQERELEMKLRRKFFSNRTLYGVFFQIFKSIKNGTLKASFLKQLVRGKQTKSLTHSIQVTKQILELLNVVEKDRHQKALSSIKKIIKSEMHGLTDHQAKWLQKYCEAQTRELWTRILRVEKKDLEEFFIYLGNVEEDKKLQIIDDELLELHAKLSRLREVEVKIDCLLAPGARLEIIYPKTKSCEHRTTFDDTEVVWTAENETDEWIPVKLDTSFSPVLKNVL
jgi:N-acetylglutamate synthase-like GNAT family acetyltransferase